MNKQALSSAKSFSQYFLKPYYGLLFAVTVLYIFSILCDTLIPWYISQIINLINSSSDKVQVYGTFLDLFVKLFVLTILARGLGLGYWLMLHNRCIYSVSNSIRHELFNLMLSKNLSFWHKNTAGDVWEKIDLTRRTTAASSSLGNIISCCYGSIFAFVIMCYFVYQIHPSLMFIFIGVGGVIFFIFNYLSNNVKKTSAQLAKFQTLTKGKIVNLIANFFLLKTFGTEKREQTRLTHHTRKLAKAMQKNAWIDKINTFSLQFLTFSFECIVLIYAVYLWCHKLIEVGDVIFVITIATQFSDYLQSFGWATTLLKSRNAILDKNLQTFTATNEFEDATKAKQLKVKDGLIEIKNLNFSYQSEPVLKNINLSIKPKEKIGIVGISGGGKTTLLHLLQRLINTPKNTIFIDGQDITSVTQKSLHQAIGFIPQDTSLFHRTVMENLKYGCFTASKKDILTAAKNAFADVFIKYFPKKYDTLVGDKGVKLSGGERQRIGIARTLLKNAPILLLDEATSALDSQSEAYIQRAITKLIKDKTVIAVAHRLSTLKNMDKIIVLDHGRIIEEGTPQSLLDEHGKFAKLWNLQQGK